MLLFKHPLSLEVDTTRMSMWIIFAMYNYFQQQQQENYVYFDNTITPGLASTTKLKILITNILGKNQFPSSLVNRTAKQHLSKFFASTLLASAVTRSNESRTHYYKLPFVGPFSSNVQDRIKR